MSHVVLQNHLVQRNVQRSTLNQSVGKDNRNQSAQACYYFINEDTPLSGTFNSRAQSFEYNPIHNLCMRAGRNLSTNPEILTDVFLDDSECPISTSGAGISISINGRKITPVGEDSHGE